MNLDTAELLRSIVKQVEQFNKLGKGKVFYKAETKSPSDFTYSHGEADAYVHIVIKGQ